MFLRLPSSFLRPLPVLLSNQAAARQDARAQGLPPLLLPYLRLAHAHEEELLTRPGLLEPSTGNRVVSAANEQAVLHQLLRYFERRLAECALLVIDPDSYCESGAHAWRDHRKLLTALVPADTEPPSLRMKPSLLTQLQSLARRLLHDYCG